MYKRTTDPLYLLLHLLIEMKSKAVVIVRPLTLNQHSFWGLQNLYAKHCISLAAKQIHYLLFWY